MAEIALTIAKLIVIGASFFGYFWLTTEKFGIVKSFAPSIICAFVAICVFVAGMFGELFVGSVVMHALGFALFAYWGVRFKFARLGETVKSLPIIALLISSLVIAIVFANATLGHYDDFSHWGTVVKDICLANALPADGSRVAAIGAFQSYAPITASFAYHLCIILGYTEGHAIVAQGVLVLSGAISILACTENLTKHSQTIPYIFLVVASAVFIVNDNGMLQIQSLLVDEVIGAYAAAALIILITRSDDIARGIAEATPILLLVSLAKENGKIYLAVAVFILAMLIACTLIKGKQRETAKRGILALFALVVLACALYLGWRFYVNVAYASGYGSSKYALSLSMFSEKQHSITQTTERVAYEAFVGNLQYAWIFWFLNISTAGALCASRFRGVSTKKLALAAFYANGVVIATCIALVIFYAFVMPASESADDLSSFYRYYGSAILTFACTIGAFLLKQVWKLVDSIQANKLLANATTVLACVVVATLIAPSITQFFFGARKVGLEHISPDSIAAPHYDSTREPISETLNAAKPFIENESDVCMYYGPEAQASYRSFLAIYEMGYKTTGITDRSDHTAILTALETTDYLIVVGDGAVLMGALAEEGISVNSGERDKIIVYKVIHHNDNITLKSSE